MKILSSHQIRLADQFTIKNEPISSLDLMERASMQCSDWLLKKFDKGTMFTIVSGSGNNGGDGLAIARILMANGFEVVVYLHNRSQSLDCRAMAEKLEDVHLFKTDVDLDFTNSDVIIDAIFGTGLSKQVEGELAEVIHKMNQAEATRVAIDLPSGLFAESNSMNHGAKCQCDYTLTFQSPKLAMCFKENHPFVGEFHVLDIGLKKDFIESLNSTFFFTTKEDITLHKRSKFSHKNSFGHAAIYAGSKGMMGAAVLSSFACLKSGVGLLNTCVPLELGHIIQTSVPEAMVSSHQAGALCHSSNINVIGIGPGLGKNKDAQLLVKNVLNSNLPLVIDADALNIISENNLLKSVKKGTVITPHIGEFERLFGEHKNDEDRLKTQIEISKSLGIFIVLKGPHTAISCPEGDVYFNSTGNPYMATSGSGDVLTGIIVSLIAQGYTPKNASICGVYWHGWAGDRAQNERGIITATDIINELSRFILNV